jgi:hypothetical protein
MPPGRTNVLATRELVLLVRCDVACLPRVEARLSVPGSATRAVLRANPGQIPGGMSTRVELALSRAAASALSAAQRRVGRAAVAGVTVNATAQGPPGGPQGTRTLRLAVPLGP